MFAGCPPPPPITHFPVTITVPTLKLNREQVLCGSVRREYFSSETAKKLPNKQPDGVILGETRQKTCFISLPRGDTSACVHVEKPQVNLQDMCFCMTQQIGKAFARGVTWGSRCENKSAEQTSATAKAATNDRPSQQFGGSKTSNFTRANQI